MKKIISLFFVVVLVVSSLMLRAQELPRSASFGAMVADLNDSSRMALGLSTLQGSLIKKVFAGSSAEKAGIAANDVVVSIDGTALQNTNEIGRASCRER